TRSSSRRLTARLNAIVSLHMKSTIGHESAMQAVHDALRVLASAPEASEDAIVNRLTELGYSVAHAEKLNVFVPSAFAWALLRRMGVAGFPNHYIALDARGAEVNVPIETEHYFTAALTLAFNTLEGGWSDELSREQFQMIIARSADMNAANAALNSGASIAGATLEPLRVFRFSAEEANNG
uniref:hypothetical protein n=1 Tax=Pelomonas sp. KK5 TaxID=1855730 RepID=UPI001E4E2200